MLLGEGQRRVAAAGASDEAQADEIGAGQRARVVERQIGHQRHPVVLDLAIAQPPVVARGVGHHRLEQEGPVRRDARRAVLADVGEEGLALLRVGAHPHLAVGAQPLDARHAVQRPALRVPARRVAAAEAVQHLVRLREREVVGADLDVEQHHVDVEEEVEVDVDDRERDRRVAAARGHAHRSDVTAAEHAHRRAAVAVGGTAAGAPFAIEEASDA